MTLARTRKDVPCGELCTGISRWPRCGSGHRINRLRERAFRIVYKDDNSSFKELLIKAVSFTIHERNIRNLAIELYKVSYGLSPKIMNLNLPLNPDSNYPGENFRPIWPRFGHLTTFRPIG